jgi:hypothetical protein
MKDKQPKPETPPLTRAGRKVADAALELVSADKAVGIAKDKK